MTPPTGQKARMLAGEPYFANAPELAAAHLRAQAILARFNAGSVVTRDLPANVVAAGNPCRVIRRL